MNQPLTHQRIRITFGKNGMFRFVGHLDLQTTWERLLRRVTVPVEYTQGFNPRPRMQFAAALPVGVTSESEFLDVWLTEVLDGDLQDWTDRLNASSPAGMPVLKIQDVPIKDSALPTMVTSADYLLTPYDDQVSIKALHERIEQALAAETLPRERRKKTYDFRPLLLGARRDATGQPIIQLMAGDAGNGRADELVEVLGYTLAELSIHRQRLYLGDEPTDAS